MKLLIVRHGATEWSVTGQHTGMTDIPLTDAGVGQAHVAARVVRNLVGDELDTATVYTSPLQRAQVTAEIVLGKDRDQFAVSDDLREYDYGDYEGLTPEQVRELQPGWDIWADGCPGGETTQQVGDRADSFLSSIADVDGLIVAFAHGHIIRIVAARAVGLEAVQGKIFTLGTAALSIIEDVRGKRVVKLWNLEPERFN
jgi:broad specificity phosphatase PhoE